MTEHPVVAADALPSMSTPEIAPGLCCECGDHTDHSRILGSVDQASGPGWTVLICPSCDLKPRPRPGRGQNRSL